MSADFVQTPLAKALGWTLFHSFWEGAVAAVILAVALCAVRTSRGRYAVACLAMLVVVVAFIITFTLAMPSARGAEKPTGTISLAPAGESRGFSGALTAFDASDVLPWLAPFWIAGVMLFHLRGVAGWIAAHRLRHRGVCPASDVWQERLAVLQARLRVAKAVALMESAVADAPVVVGYLRPMILTPVGMLAGMPASQVEAILTHELAHIRRHDYLVNLLQTVVEGFLFYHPAIWWISGVIRAERENCCDDLVVAASGNAPEYAAALTALEQSRHAAGEAALAATGGHLMKRIRRLLYPLEKPRAALTPVISAGVLSVAAALALMAWQAPQAQQPAVSSWNDWLTMDAAYIITNEERAAFRNLQTDEERAKFVEQFWDRRNPTPGSPDNPFRIEHYRRIVFANAHFGSQSSIPGWKTDRGRIYITFGPPDEIDAHHSPATASESPFEDWRYLFLDGIGSDVIIRFVDTGNNGEYHMTRDPNEKDAIRRVAPSRN